MRGCYLLLALSAAAWGADREIPMDTLRDKVEGGWAGQMIGVSFGAPTEFRHLEKIIEGDLPEWKPEMVRGALNQDDLYVDMTFAQVLDAKGLDATTADFGEMLRDARFRLWHANLAARRALKRGVPASKSGTPEFNAHANDIDFQIEADFAGLMAPGMPRAAGELCLRAGRVMNHGDGILGGVFVAAMYSAAFFENDPAKVVEAGLAMLPPASPYARAIADTLAWSRETPGDWRAVWKRLEEKHNGREACPNGALRPFNIDARLNGAYIALGLLHGGGDFEKTLEIATRAGQDSDCNPSSACGVLGVILGYKGIPEKWRSGIPAISSEKFRYTEYTFPTIVESTMRRAAAVAARNGGGERGGTLRVRTQTPRAVNVALWDSYGSPAERVAASSPRWVWKGEWRAERNTRVAAAKGAEASIEFEGAGAILVGPLLPSGGRVAVYLDGKPHRTVDVYPDEDQAKRSEAIWHVFGLRPGKHTVRAVVTGERFGESTGTDVAIEDLVVFR
ncbi:MAG: ADP-ribosylglycohydrolase family protein [Bryobacteraceae bacterium]